MALVGGGRRSCRVCGKEHTACGTPTFTVPVDLRTREENPVGELRLYRAVVNGNVTTLKLTEADAELYPGAELVAPEAPAVPRTRARRAANKARPQVAPDAPDGTAPPEVK